MLEDVNQFGLRYEGVLLVVMVILIIALAWPILRSWTNSARNRVIGESIVKEGMSLNSRSTGRMNLKSRSTGRLSSNPIIGAVTGGAAGHRTVLTPSSGSASSQHNVTEFDRALKGGFLGSRGAPVFWNIQDQEANSDRSASRSSEGDGAQVGDHFVGGLSPY
jgi:hypothetical protein